MKQLSGKAQELQLIALCVFTVLPGCATGASSLSVAPPEWRQVTPEAPVTEDPEEAPPFHADPPPAPKKRSFYFYPMLAVGLSGGGDTFGEFRYSDGDVSEVSFGGAVQLGGGLMVDFTQLPLQLQTMLTYHVTGGGATNGLLQFDRWPVDVLGFYKLTRNIRVGGGLQYVINPQLRMANRGKTETATIHYDNALGLVAEGASSRVARSVSAPTCVSSIRPMRRARWSSTGAPPLYPRASPPMASMSASPC